MSEPLETHPFLLLLLFFARPVLSFFFRRWRYLPRAREQILNTPSADALASTSSSSSALTDSQAQNLAKKNNLPHLSLSEVGPRFVLNPVKIFEGSFNGACLYENKGEFLPFPFFHFENNRLEEGDQRNPPPPRPEMMKPETLTAHSLARSRAEFIPSSQRYASAKLARAVKYRGRKDQQAVSQVRREGLHVGQKDDPLEKRSVFA